MARGIVYSTERLHTLFEPRSIALVGASDKSTWSLMIHVGLTQGGFDGKVYYINPRNPTVHGQPTVARLTEIEEPVDLCYIMVGTDAVLPVIQDMIAAGIHNAVVLTGASPSKTSMEENCKKRSRGWLPSTIWPSSAPTVWDTSISKNASKPWRPCPNALFFPGLWR
jgi:predicted CoA-binding protein